MEFSRQEYWSWLPFPSPGDLPDPRIKPPAPALAGRFFTTEPPGKSPSVYYHSTVARSIQACLILWHFVLLCFINIFLTDWHFVVALWWINPCWHQFSNNICLLPVSCHILVIVTIFQSFFIIIIFAMVICDCIFDVTKDYAGWSLRWW